MASAAILSDRFGGAGQRPQGLSLTYQRLMLMMLVFAGVTMLIAGRLLFLQLFTDRGGAGQIGNPLIPPRADIVDRNGNAAGPDDRRLVDRRPSRPAARQSRRARGQARPADAGAKRRRI